MIVQHLDPTHKGLLVELLQHSTSMPVAEAKERARVKAGHVYVIPPNKDLSISHGVLHLHVPERPRGLRLPIDFFFRSLAEDQGENAVGVVLSGMGSDGTAGLAAIRDHEGGTFAQDPASAGFASMPESAIGAGVADVVASVESLPDRIALHAVGGGTAEVVPPPQVREPRSGLDKVLVLLRQRTGHDFSLYKKSTVYRRIERRMGVRQVSTIADYAALLPEAPEEIDELFREMLIGVTSFFRDPESWEVLESRAWPELFSQRPPEWSFRAWCPVARRVRKPTRWR